MEEKIIVWEAEATAEDLAKKVAELMKEDLVGFTRQEGSKINFRLAGGQSFVLTVEKV
jgi:hypothetical protein